MLRKFKIAIDGKEYLVEMEEIGGVAQPLQVAPTSIESTPIPEEVPVQQPITTVAGNDAMTSPMPGSILKILVQVGDSIKENQPLLILEAMKMENEIVANHAGTVTSIHVTQGQGVNAGDALITIH